jgi:hypothetical protein
MFIFTWVFDKLGYMPKINMEVGKINIEAAWPFPAETEEKPKPQVKKKPTAKKPAVVVKTARAKKTK